MARLLLTGLMLLVALPARGAYIVEPTMQPIVRPLMAVPTGAPAGTAPAGASLEQQRVIIRFKTADGATATFALYHPSKASPGDHLAGPFAVRASLPKDHALTRAFLTASAGLADTFRWGLAGSAGEPSPLEVARARLVMVDVDGVKAAIGEALQSAPKDLAVLRQGAVILQAAEQTEDAAALVARARAELPDVDRSVYQEAEHLALSAIDGEVAAEATEALVARGEAGACAAIRVADTFDLLGRADAAQALADRALAAAPGCRDAHQLVCELLGRAKDWEGLLARSEAGVATFPEHGDFEIQRATALRGLGRHDEARDVLEAEVRKNPQDTGPMSSLAALYTMTRTSEAGYAALDGACKADPDDLVSCFLAGVIAHYLAKHDACVAHMMALLERLPTQPRVPMYAAISSYWMDKVEDADRLIAEAASISGATDPDVYYCRALIRMKRDRQGAIADLERFLTVAHRGWHSQGKIGRVNHELAMLKRGEIPPPAEAHHRRQSTEPAADAAATKTSDKLSADDLLKDASGAVAGGLTPLHHIRTDWNPDHIAFGFKTDQGDTVELRLTRVESGSDDALVLGPYAGTVRITTPSKEPSPALTAAVDTLVQRVRGHADRGPALRRVASATASPDARGPPDALPSAHKRHAEAEQTSAIEFWLCLLLVFAMVLLVPLLLRRSWRLILMDAKTIGPFSAWVALGGLIAIVAFVQLVLVPRELVTVFAGYGAVSEAWALRPVIKYGAATTALYGPLLGFFGPSTEVVIGTNLVFGLGTVLLAGGLAARMSQNVLGGLLAVVLVGLMPALLRDRASESILVPMSFWVLASMVHLDAWRELGCRKHALGAIVTGALALHARPEAWVVLPLLWLAVASWTPQGKRLLAVGGAVVALGLPRLWSLLHYASSASESGDVPGLANAEFSGLFERFLGLNSLWWPEVFPVSALLVALVALVVVPRARVRSVGLLLVSAMVWQALSTLDLPPVSAPRTQAPAMLWIALLAASTLGRGLAQAGPLRAAAVLGALLVLVPTPSNLTFLWQPTNAQRFDDWWGRAIERVHDEGVDRCLVALDMSDPPRDSVIRLYPSYELAVRSGRLEVFGLTTFLDAPDLVLKGHCEPLYLEGPQCRARFFGFDGEPPPTAELLPVCEKMHAGFNLTPLSVEDADNAGNADFPVYGLSPTLRYGLYRIDGAVK